MTHQLIIQYGIGNIFSLGWVRGNTKAFVGQKSISFDGHTHEISQINNLQNEINSLKTSVSSGKAAIASAVTDKGVQTAADATFNTMAQNIRNIPTGRLAKPIYDGSADDPNALSQTVTGHQGSSSGTIWFDMSYNFNGNTKIKKATCAFLVGSSGRLGCDLTVGQYTISGANYAGNGFIICTWEYIDDSQSVFYMMDGSILLNVTDFVAKCYGYDNDYSDYRLNYRIDEYR